MQNKNAPFGWINANVSIDGIEMKNYHLMPFGNGKLFLPVKAEIRKKIKKNVGDYVHIIVWPNNEPLEIPEDILACLQDEPDALKFFNSLHESEKMNYIKWISTAKTEDTKVKRIANTLDRLKNRQSFYEK